MFTSRFNDAAREEWRWLEKNEQTRLLDAIDEQLSQQPGVETRNRKQLRQNPLASHELRADELRVFFNLYETERLVEIVAVGRKEHNDLIIRGKKVEL